MLQVTINNKPYNFQDNVTILEALITQGIEVPRLCHDKRLKPFGGCRLCVVKVNKFSRPVTSCNTPLENGMVIETHTPLIENYRRTLLKLLARSYPKEAMYQFPDKQFHNYIRIYKLENELLEDSGKKQPSGSRYHTDTSNCYIDDSHPYIHIDMSKCVYCFRCVRICQEVQGQFVWEIWNRGNNTRIFPDSGNRLLASSCVSCGACADTCPTGALEDKTILTNNIPEKWTRTTCSYCGTGCEMLVGTYNKNIVQIKPLETAPVSKGHLCVKGRYAFEFARADDRITEPMIRVNGSWKNVSWTEAIEFIKKEFQRIATKYGADSIGVLGSSRATNEENYLAQKFARVVIGTNNVDCCARVCHAPTAAAMKKQLGTGAATNSFDDIEMARTILLCGSNPTENHPIAGARIKQAVLQGANLIVIDPRKIELTRYAKYHLQLRPGTNIPLLNALAYTIIDENLYDKEFIRERVADWDKFQNFIKEFPPEKIAEICGVDNKLIRSSARLFARESPSICFHGLGVTEHTQGTDGVNCLVNLALLTGNMGKRGAGINPLRGQNNVQGSAHMGCEPKNLTGFVSISSGKELFESVWQANIPLEKGLNMLEMIDAASQDRFKALWVIGYDILLTNADAHSTEKGLEQMELVIVQDIFMNETAKKYGTVFLPCASPFEKDGTFMNSERRIQRIQKVIEPLGNSKPDWKIICDVAHAMGKNKFFNYQSPEEIWNEVRAVWKVGSGISYQRIENGGLQWPCPTEDHPGTQVLHTDTFPIGKQAPLQCIEYNPTKEVTTKEYPFLLTTGRNLYHFNAGTMTMRTLNTVLHPSDTLDISPEDAKKLKLSDGDTVKIRSRYGEAILPLKIDSRIKQGELFATFHTPQLFINYITSPHRDTHVLTPEYKVTAVQIKKI